RVPILPDRRDTQRVQGGEAGPEKLAAHRPRADAIGERPACPAERLIQIRMRDREGRVERDGLAERRGGGVELRAAEILRALQERLDRREGTGPQRADGATRALTGDRGEQL